MRIHKTKSFIFKLTFLIGVLAVVFSASRILIADTFAGDGTDYTDDIQVIGNVNMSKAAYARNVWDMQEFDGKIYIGHGNSSNYSKTAVNAGPIPVVYLDPTTNLLTSEYTVDDEEVWRLNVIDGVLYTPGDDPRTGGWNLGNLYYKEVGEDWVMKRTIPGGIHLFDVVKYDGKLYVAVGADPQYNGATSVQYSEDGGNTWSMGISEKRGSRVYSLMTYGGSLYGVAMVISSNNSLYFYGCEITAGETIPATCTSLIGTFPVSGVATGNYLIKNKFEFDGKLVFNTLSSISTGSADDFIDPGDIYYTSSFPNSLTKLELPDANAKPIDMINKDGAVYILANIENSSTSFTNIVYKTTDLSNLTEVLRFNYGSFARSFEKIGDEYFFGIGSKDVTSPSALSGNILRISLTGSVITRPTNNADISFIAASASVANSLTGTTQYAGGADTMLSPAFNSTSTSYSISLPYRFTWVRLSGAASNGATISGLTTHNLSVGENTIQVTSTALDGVTQKTYTVNATRRAASTVNNLAALSVSDGSTTYALDQTFSSSRTSYTVTVPESISDVTILARASSSTLAPVSSDDTDSAMTSSYDSTTGYVTFSGTVSGISKGGSKEVEIVVTSESGAEKTYTVTVSREGAQLSSDATLSSLSVGSYGLSPTFSSSVTSYSTTVPYEVESISSLSYAVSNSAASTSVSGNSGFVVGQTNIIRVVVTAEDGTTKEYTINVTRSPRVLSTNNNLSNLTASSGVFDQSFSSSVTQYYLSLDNSVDSVTLTPTKADSAASISGDSLTQTGLVAGDVRNVDIIVTSESGATKTYKVIIYRADASGPTTPDSGFLSDNTYQIGSGASIVFSAQIDYGSSSEVEVKVDDIVLVKGQDCELEHGSTIVTLSPVFLNTLTPGSHRLTVTFASGLSVHGTFNVLAASITGSGGVGVPDTGISDTNNSSRQVAYKVLILTIVAVLFMIVKNRLSPSTRIITKKK